MNNLSDFDPTQEANGGGDDFMNYLLAMLQEDALSGPEDQYANDPGLRRIVEALRASERGEPFMLRPEDLDALEGTGTMGAMQ